MCSLHLTHPSVHTWSSGQPTVQRPGSSRGLPVGAGIRTHNLGLPRVSSPTLYPLSQRLPRIVRWRIVHGLIATNRHRAHLDPEVGEECSFCGQSETVFHLFLYCGRLEALLSQLEEWCGILG